MSELKTCRCEICKEIYYSDEVKTKIEVRVDAGDQGSTYTHVCPICESEISKVISNPSIINDLLIEKSDAENCIGVLENTVKVLRDKICGWKFYSFRNCVTNVKEMATEIENKYNEIQKSRNLWFRVCWILVGLIIGNLIGKFIF